MTRRARQLMVALLRLLAAQFVLGMTANLYAQIPHAPPGSTGQLRHPPGQRRTVGAPSRPTRDQAPRRGGTDDRACAITLSVLAIRSRDWPWAVFALLGLVMAASAGIFGAAFLAYRPNDTYSLLMSVGFLGALLSCWTGLYLSRRTSA
ncbi:MAG TPA: hypothetical protein VIV12_23745 [Streptosporangiaceae bacterium]